MIRPYNFGDQYTEDVGRVGAGIRDAPGLHVYYGVSITRISYRFFSFSALLVTKTFYAQSCLI